MTKVQLKINGEIKPFEIEEVTIKQTKKAIKVIKTIIEEFKGNSKIGDFMEFLTKLDGDKDKKSNVKDTEFGIQLAESFDFLLEEVPEQMVALLAIISGIEEDTLDGQPFATLFDVFDGVVEVNDIEKLVNRGKKSLALTKVRWAMTPFKK